MAVLSVTPYLYYDDADAALDWMERVLGFTDPVRWRDERGTVVEAEITAGIATVSVSRRPATQVDDALFIVKVDDVDAEHARIARRVEGTVDPPADQSYGPRTFTVRDPWGYRWTFWQGRATPPDDQ